MLISNVIKEVDLILFQKQGGGDGMYGCIAPSLIVEASRGVKELEVCLVCFSAPEV